MKKDTPDYELRRKAEKKLKEATSSAKDLSGASHDSMATLIQELEIHQIELKMQNDELRKIQSELEKTRDKYSHLYDFAPIGYFTLSEKGIIEEANLTISSMLGLERGVLIGKPFTRFILREDQDIFFKHRQHLVESETPQSCEPRLIKTDGHEFYARLDCMILKNECDDLRQIRVAVSDITESRLAQEQRDKLVSELQKALSEVKTLRGFLPICSHCKKIRDDKGYWNQIESYIQDRSEAEFSHGICPECAKQFYPDIDIYDDNGEVTGE